MWFIKMNDGWSNRYILTDSKENVVKIANFYKSEYPWISYWESEVVIMSSDDVKNLEAKKAEREEKRKEIMTKINKAADEIKYLERELTKI